MLQFNKEFIVKKWVAFIFIGIAIFTFWLIEPFSNNPFHQLTTPLINNKVSYACQVNNSRIGTSSTPIMANYMANNEFLGVSAGVYKEGCGYFIGSSGYSDKRQLVPFQPDTIARIASVTKPMTAVAIMQLVERELIDLDAPVKRYLPDFSDKLKQITIRQLLNHTSGIPHYSSKLDAMSFSKYDTLDDAVTSILQRELVSKPGEAYRYSSFAYTVLGMVIEKASNMSFEEYLKKNIWQKAGMVNTSLETTYDLDKKSRLYIKLGSVFIRSPYTDLSIIYPGGGVQSTAEDLLLFGQAILENRLISQTTLSLMIDVSESLAMAAGDDPYGLGWSVRESAEKGLIISHGGAQPGASVYFEILLDKSMVNVAISNAFGTKNSVYNLANDLSNIAL